MIFDSMQIENYRLDSVETVAGNVKVFRFSPLNTKPNGEEFKPGQFVFIHYLVDGKGVDKRPYSISSAPNEKYLEFCIDMINGRFTSKLDLLKVGDIVGVEGPSGHLCYDNQTKIGMIAGGTGIAPMMSMMREISKNPNGRNAMMFYSSKTEKQVLYRSELEGMGRKGAIKTVITLTREDENKTWNGEKGRICKEMIAKYATDVSERSWFICGPLAMIKTMKEALLELGADPKKLKMEGWG
ncbi:MAG: ferredoxin--NADP reductase [Candidatus Bilamarchaeum sp.]|jgi:ferredoxin-NADP reductase